jgi:transcriptional regulator with XRE-family HTH domain
MKELGFKTQNKFAEDIGEPQGKISRYISGDVKPGIDFIEKLALKFHNLNIKSLLTGQGGLIDEGRNPNMSSEIIDLQKEEIASLQKLLEVQTKKARMFEQENARLEKIIREKLPKEED